MYVCMQYANRSNWKCVENNGVFFFTSQFVVFSLLSRRVLTRELPVPGTSVSFVRHSHTRTRTFKLEKKQSGIEIFVPVECEIWWTLYTMLKTPVEHRYKFHCPIRHPSRDITKTRFHIQGKCFRQKRRKIKNIAVPRHFLELGADILTRDLEQA